ncbi:MAG: radical SAM protein [Bacteroidales bacterium]|nr:radical SAM protein [Bacteroidales bacterium]
MDNKVPKHIIKGYNKTRNFYWRPKICYAPFNSIRFSLSGNMYFCCYNRFYSLGKYPEVSIREAWNGAKAQEFRSYITDKNLSLGCHACYTKLLSQNFYSVGARIYDGYKARKQGPSLMEFEISNICNLECVMCNGENSSLIRKNREKGEPYPIVYDEAFVEQIKEFIPYLEEARFVGGEPFLSELYFKIWNEIIHINPKTKINVLTNGTILNDRILDLYKKHNFHISFSIDSVKKETYESIRVNANYDKVMHNFQTIYELSRKLNKELSVNICPIQANMWEIPDMIEYYSKLNVPIIIHTVVYPVNLSISNLTKEQLKKYLEFLNERLKHSKQESKNNSHFLIWSSFISQVNSYYKMANEKILFEKDMVDDLVEKLKNRINSNENLKEWLKLNEILSGIEDKALLRKIIIGLFIVDKSYILAELKNSTMEQIKQRLININ